MIKHLTLRSKIFFIFMVMAAITVAGGIIMLWYTYKIDNMLVTMVQKEIVLYKAAQEMELALANQKGFLTYYFVDGNDKWLESLGRYREIFRKSLDKAYSLQLNEQQQEHLTKISLGYEKYIIAKDNAIENYKHNRRDGDLSIIHGEQRSVFFNLLKLCRNFSLNQWMVMQETEHENNIRSANLRMVTFGAIFFFVILCGLLLFILYKQILEPIRGLAIETGSSPKASSRDEVVSLSLSLKGMMKDFDDTHDELARNRESLVQAERMAMVGEMAAGVAHTIRNPFTSIKMRMFSLSRSLELSEIQNEDLQVISDEIARIDKIVQSFLEFARPPKLSMKQSNISTIISSVLTLLEYRLEEHNVDIVYDSQPELPDVEVDPDRIKEALVNIIINACESMENSGRIIISETREHDPTMGDILSVSIVDNGPGIPENIMEKITNPFFTTKEEGSGLGLSIVARIVKEHNGIFSVSSVPGKSTKFIIQLPVNRTKNEPYTDN